MTRDAVVDTLVEIATLHDPEHSYDWEEIRAYKNPESGELFWSSQGGCSCYDFEVPEALSDFDGRTYDIGDVVAVFRNWHPNVNSSTLDAEIRKLRAAAKGA